MPRERRALAASAPAAPDPRLADPDRLAALARTGLLDSPPEDSFDRLTRLAARWLSAPVALLSLVDDRRQFLKSAVGLGEPWVGRREMPLSHSFCRHVVATGRPLAIANAPEHALVRDTLAIRDLGAVAYLGVPLRTDDGVVLGACGVIDHRPRAWTPAEAETLADLAALAVTEIELRASQAVLKASEARWRNLFDQIPYPAWVIDLESLRFIEVNAAAVAGYGYSLEEFHRLRLTDIRPPGDVPRLTTAIQRPRADGLFSGERVHVLADGRVIPVRVTAHRFEYAGRPASLTIVEDITERLAVERLKDEFLGIVSHELRTPLTSIRAALGLLTQTTAPVPDEARREMLAIAERNADRLVGLINDLLDAERLISGKAPLALEPCAAAELIRQAAEGLRSMAEQAGVTLVTAPTRLRLRGDPGRLSQVLTNLIGNAVKFSPAGGVVRVGAERGSDAMVQFWVSDEGPGIPAEQQERIFDRFYQVNASTTRQQEGSGLGLAICRAIVAQHDGRIWVESTPGQGSLFRFSVPADRSRRRQRAAGPP